MKLIKINKDHYIIIDDLEKMTHSTNVFDEHNLDLQNISLQEIKELIGEVDVEKKAEQEYREYPNNPKKHPDWQYGRDTNCHRKRKAFIKGYNQALEDNKDKKYTEDDLITFGIRVTSEAFSIIDGKGYVDMKKFDKILQSLQNKTEWEVEIVDGKLKLK